MLFADMGSSILCNAQWHFQNLGSQVVYHLAKVFCLEDGLRYILLKQSGVTYAKCKSVISCMPKPYFITAFEVEVQN